VSEESAGDDAARGCRTVLIVDDNSDVRELVRISLERGPYRTLQAADGPAGLALAEQARPDLILLDVDLPEIDGFAVCRQLKAGATTSGIKVLMLTAAVQQENRERALAAGADGYITKPFRLQALMDRLAAEIG
jgi:DNA-binding response OmpR family regulator